VVAAAGLAGASAVGVLSTSARVVAQPITEVFECVPGPTQESQELTVPAGVTQIRIEAFGGQGCAGEASTNPGGPGGLGGSDAGGGGGGGGGGASFVHASATEPRRPLRRAQRARAARRLGF